MSINIEKVKGDVVASEKQTGGFTGKIIYSNNFFSKHKKSIIVSIILFFITLIGVLSNLATILNFFNIKYP